jgi:hypothetical protein
MPNNEQLGRSGKIARGDLVNVYTENEIATLQAARDILAQTMGEFSGEEHMVIGLAYHKLAQVIGYPDGV